MKKIIKIKKNKLILPDCRLNWMEDESLEKILEILDIIPVQQENESYLSLLPVKMEHLDEEINVLVHDSQQDLKERLLFQLKLLKTFREPGHMEYSRLIGCLEKYADQDRQECEKLLSLYGKKYDDLKTIGNYSSIWQTYFMDKNVPLKRIVKFRNEDLRDALKFILKDNPGINQLEKTAVLLQEIGGMEKESLENVIRDYHKALGETGASYSLKDMTVYLYARRYPTITKYRQELNKALKTINVPETVHLGSDQDFELPGFSLSSQIQSETDLKEYILWLQENAGALTDIIRVYRRQNND